MMKDEDLREVLQALPRIEASDRFTENLMERLEERAPERSGMRAILIAAMVLMMVSAAVVMERQMAAQAPAAADKDLLAETRRIEKDLAEIRQITDRITPEVELGYRDGTRYVLGVSPDYDSGVEAVSYEY